MDYFHYMEDLTGQRCKKLQDVSFISLSVSIVIVVGILFSYLPQHYRIVARRSSEGISPWFILLGTTSGTSSFANILALPESRADVKCCKQVSAFECTAGLLGIVQVGVQCFCFTIILLLFLIFFPRPSSLPHANRTDNTQPKHTWRTAVIVSIMCLLHALVVCFISGWLLLAKPHHLGTWANSLGIMSTILAGIQYVPQILLTWRLGHVGSLSIPMMCIQTPGSYLFAWSLWNRLGLEGWSTWGVFLVTGSLQGCLLVMGIYFNVKARRENEALAPNNASARCVVGYISTAPGVDTDDEGGAVVEDENTPLINGSRASKKSSKKSLGRRIS